MFVGYKCILKLVFGIDCAGCGGTRMVFSLLDGNFYQAFRYNNLLFILSPLFVFLILEDFYSIYKNRKPLYLKINNKYYYIIIIILILFGIIRNIIPELGPVTI